MAALNRRKRPQEISQMSPEFGRELVSEDEKSVFEVEIRLGKPQVELYK